MTADAATVLSYSTDGRRIPGWSIGGGVSGPDIPVTRCEACAAARDPELVVYGLNADVFVR